MDQKKTVARKKCPGLRAFVVTTMTGPVLYSLRVTPFMQNVTIPVNMTARVEIPLPGGEGSLTLDGEPVRARTVKGFAVVDGIASGNHTFKTSGVVKKRN